MIDPPKEHEFILDMVGDLKLGRGCLVKIKHQALIGYYIWSIGKAYPFSQFEITVQRSGQFEFDLNIYWIGVKDV